MIANAIFGLVGVVVGGLVTFGIQEWTAWHKRVLESRVAARLTHTEFCAALAVLDEVMRRADSGSTLPSWWSWGDPLSAWRDCQSALAERLPLHAWQTVNNGALAIAHADLARRLGEEAGDPRPSGDALNGLHEDQSVLAKAVELLHSIR